MQDVSDVSDNNQNISYFLHEVSNNSEKDKSMISYDEIMQQVLEAEKAFDDKNENKYSEEIYQLDDMSSIMALELDYDTNYRKKDLERIADYYEISKRKKKKCDLIQDIIIYENTPENFEKVFTRKKLWGYLQEIMEDSYLKQFLILD